MPLFDVDLPLQDLMSSHGFSRAEVAAAEQLARQLFESEGLQRRLPGASDAAPSSGSGLRGGRAGAASMLPDAATPTLQKQVSTRSATGVPSVPSQQQQQPNRVADAAAAEAADGPASMDTAQVEQLAGDAADVHLPSLPLVQSAVLSASSAAQPDAKKYGMTSRTLMPSVSSTQRDVVLLTFEMFERIWMG